MKASIAFLFCIVVGFAQAFITYEDVLEAEFVSFKGEHKKTYADHYEEKMRLRIFKDNMKMIDEHNKRYEAGGETYTMGVNQFTDLLAKEFQELWLAKFNPAARNAGIKYTYSPSNVKTVDSIDWNAKGAVTPVKDQGKCGSCWAFAATGALESQIYIQKKQKETVPLSEQNLLDCSSDYGNNGCKGGFSVGALFYVMDNKGIDTAAAYPYEAVQGSCRYKSDGAVTVPIKGVAGTKGGEEALAEVVSEMGPVGVAVDASKFQHYADGIFSDPDCKGNPNHEMLVTGFTSDAWLMKNSWGTTWGEKGYMKLARNKNNLCQVASYVVLPIV